MKKKKFLLSFKNNGSTIKQISASINIVRFSCFLLSVLAIFMVYLIYDYITLKKTTNNNIYLRETVLKQEKELNGQRRQIQLYADEIKDIKSKLTTLHEFEKKIRAMANIKRKKQEAILGIGGSNPENMDTTKALTEKHANLMSEMHEQVAEINFAANRQHEEFKSILSFFEEQHKLLSATPSIRPASGSVSSTFGYRTAPFTGKREFHKGIDIASTKGTPIVATGDGIVSKTGYMGSFGKTIVINHGHGMITYYGHTSKILKKPGSIVKRGETIARIGNTGRSTGPHVHYEVRLNSVSVNPKKYILN
ncbi:MAG: peptidoglycan DD-metalloendopeptidase family protein [Pseudomonadota bacterium]